MSKQEWKPIDTAPKDGTPILIWQTHKMPRRFPAHDPYDDDRYAIGYWRVGAYRPAWGNRNDSEVTPSHWMPLPKPPRTP